MALTTEENVEIANLKCKNKATAINSLGWTSEQYDEWSDEFHESLKKLSPAELRNFERKQNKEMLQVSLQLSMLRFLVRLTIKTKLPFIRLYSIFKPFLRM